MIIEILLAIGRSVDRLLGTDRPARSSLSVWRMPLQLPEGDGPWAYTAPEIPDDIADRTAIDSEGWLSSQEAAELLELDIERSSPRH